jgi:hypothetical protein
MHCLSTRGKKGFPENPGFWGSSNQSEIIKVAIEGCFRSIDEKSPYFPLLPKKLFLDNYTITSRYAVSLKTEVMVLIALQYLLLLLLQAENLRSI